MSAILHTIVTDIENERIKNNIMEWRNKLIIDKQFLYAIDILTKEKIYLGDMDGYETDDTEIDSDED